MNSYRGMDDDRRYNGKEIDVTFSAKRCIHAAECGRGLRDVFDTDKRPWVQPDNGDATSVAAVIRKCPSGALHYELHDGSREQPPGENIVTMLTHGSLRFQGDLRISGGNVEIDRETRATLCRCGASHRKPFCDNSHREIEFNAPAGGRATVREEMPIGGRLEVRLRPDGPIEVEGRFEIRDENGETLFQSDGGIARLCRCGASVARPFCDRSHERIGFQAP